MTSSLSLVMKEKGIEKEDLDTLANNTVWLVTNYDKLKEKYPDEYVAVNGKRLVDHDQSMSSLLERLKSKYNKTNHFAIEFVSKEDFELIL